ncbi:hypothetical protein MNBD_NITROSPINAE02-480 [hydrothermal vent metagenome]|uniref:Bacterial sugar transferase domain-containing protein n=1 Tax=hydrothermal vent metagenome TaxID=652676 RepID=A0A3B1CWN9_9ZZZZ
MVAKSGRDSWNVPRKHGILKEHDPILSLLQLVVDSVIAAGSLFVLISLRPDTNFDSSYRILTIVVLLMMWVSYNRFSVYRHPTDTLGTLGILFKAWGLVILVIILLAFVTKTSELFSRQIIITWVISTYLLQVTFHNIVPEIFYRLFGEKDKKTRALMVGGGELGKYLTSRINENPWLPVKIVGVVDDDETFRDGWDIPGVPFLGDTHAINEIIKKENVGSIYIVLPMTESKTIERLYLDLVDKNIDINWAPDIFGMILINHNVKELAGVPLLALSESPLSGSQALVKSMFDKTLAVIALILLGPVMLATAIAIRRESEGPVFFKQKRHGWDNEIFEVWKFRSMFVHKEDEGKVTQATKEDPRITKVGKFIRSASIDELPQLFNVLEGNMSLVGPRPHALEHDDFYAERINKYFARGRIKPGITGLAQVSGFRGETETIDKMKKRVEYDIEYINNWSISLDLQILMKTIFIVLFQKAY